MRKAGFVIALGLLGATPLLAKHPEPADPFRCIAVNGGVLLEWSFVFIAPIEAYVILRDGEPLVKLPPDATSYFDGAVPAGTHAYALLAINWTGELLDLAKCEVVVEDSGLRCKVDGNKVYLEWGPILIDVLILKFRISRNGETIATVPTDQLSYVDTVFAVGGYRYAVHAVTSPDSELLVGTCGVTVTCFGLKTEVAGLTVYLAWDPSPIVSPVRLIYIVTRDDELVAKAERTEYKDAVPGPGTYLYQVYEDFGTTRNVPIRLVGACLVEVPGPIPGPQDLVCAIDPIDPVPLDPVPLDPATVEAGDPGAIDSDGDGIVDSTIPVVVIALKWMNPIRYDKIVILRNDIVIATLEGPAEGYRDRVRAGGTFHYLVIGILSNRRSEPAECKVEVPPTLVPPPQDLTCRVIDVIDLEPVDPTDPQPIGGGVDAIPVPVVILRWWNPIRYAKLVVLRDGTELARLAGDATGYRDVNPPSGLHVYGVYGIVDDGRRSRAVTCEVEVGPRPVPPVENLQCLVTQPTAANARASVILVWENAAAYDKILVIRDGVVIFEDTGELRKYLDIGVPPGVHVYCIVAVLDGRRSTPTCCQVVIEGPPARNLLYFTPGAIEPVPVDLGVPPPIPEPIPPLPGNRITCLANNPDPVHGWSFGVGNDPQFIVPRDANIRGTATQAFHGGRGPDFLHIDLLDDGRGVVMAVVIDVGASPVDPPETLPPGRGHRLLNIVYAAGPHGVPGEAYPVRYTNTLGSPPVQVLFVVKGFEVVPATLPGWVSLPGPRFLRGDSNGDGHADLSDAKHTLDWLFLGGKKPGCMEAANANGSAQVNIADPIYLLQFLFSGGPAPPFPFPFCALAPAPLTCEDPGICILPVLEG
ncbi:MAG: hypothetical protein HY721_34340 [Planctomycetes bacterium]|nr:hypothetical protein [Planctomycetota bacterium]